MLDRLPLFLLAMPAWLPQAHWLSTLTHCATAFVLLLVPTTLIGGTFPVLSRVAVRRADEAGVRVGRLYTANTVGALIGTLLAGFVLMRFLGINRALIAAAAANLGIAAYAWRAAQAAAGSRAGDIHATDSQTLSPPGPFSQEWERGEGQRSPLPFLERGQG